MICNEGHELNIWPSLPLVKIIPSVEKASHWGQIREQLCIFWPRKSSTNSTCNISTSSSSFVSVIPNRVYNACLKEYVGVDINLIADGGHELNIWPLFPLVKLTPKCGKASNWGQILMQFCNFFTQTFLLP